MPATNVAPKGGPFLYDTNAGCVGSKQCAAVKNFVDESAEPEQTNTMSCLAESIDGAAAAEIRSDLSAFEMLGPSERRCTVNAIADLQIRASLDENANDVE